MAIESNDGGICITGGHMALYRLMTMKAAMEFELKTGMRMTRVNVFNVAKKKFGLKGGKPKVLAQVCSILEKVKSFLEAHPDATVAEVWANATLAKLAHFTANC